VPPPQKLKKIFLVQCVQKIFVFRPKGGGIAQCPPPLNTPLHCSVLFCSVLFSSRPQSEGWPHHGRTFSIYRCPLSFCYWHCSHSMQGGVYETVELPSICLSVCPSIRPCRHSAAARRCDGFAAVSPVARKYRSIAPRPALSSKREQCHVCQLT